MEFKKKDLFTIPNILTYIRLICIPVFVWLMIEYYLSSAKSDLYMWASFGVFLFAEHISILIKDIHFKNHIFGLIQSPI